MMLTGLAQYVLLGHSERRAAGESDKQIARKVAAAAEAGLIPILFVGEDEPGAGAHLQAEQRLRRGISRIDVGQQAVLVVYEPTWAIGADRAADAEFVSEMVARLKDVPRQLGATDPKVLYGGTMRKKNIKQFAGIDVLDGVGATRVSLEVHEFFSLIDRMAGSGSPVQVFSPKHVAIHPCRMAASMHSTPAGPTVAACGVPAGISTRCPGRSSTSPSFRWNVTSPCTQ